VHVVILATQEAEAGGSRCRAKLMRPYLKNKIQTKGLGAWFKWESESVCSRRP
jgi:hypothetical protein